MASRKDRGASAAPPHKASEATSGGSAPPSGLLPAAAATGEGFAPSPSSHPAASGPVATEGHDHDGATRLLGSGPAPSPSSMISIDLGQSP